VSAALATKPKQPVLYVEFREDGTPIDPTSGGQQTKAKRFADDAQSFPHFPRCGRRCGAHVAGDAATHRITRIERESGGSGHLPAAQSVRRCVRARARRLRFKQSIPFHTAATDTASVAQPSPAATSSLPKSVTCREDRLSSFRSNSEAIKVCFKSLEAGHVQNAPNPCSRCGPGTATPTQRLKL